MPQIYDMQLYDLTKAQTISNAGGGVIVCVNNDYLKVPLLNPDAGFAALANPLPIVNGRIRFATADAVTLVSLYGFSPTGHALAFQGIGAGQMPELNVDTGELLNVAVIPFAAADYVAGAERDTGLDLPALATVSPFAAVRVSVAEASRTIGFGILSTEPSGNATGFGTGVSLATAGLINLQSAATATRGALLGGSTLDRGHTVLATSRSISLSTSAGTVSARGALVLPYTLAPTP
jgi:hypothetical protein